MSQEFTMTDGDDQRILRDEKIEKIELEAKRLLFLNPVILIRANIGDTPNFLTLRKEFKTKNK